MGLEIDKNRLSYWYPILREVIPEDRMPHTVIVRYEGGGSPISLCDGETPDGWWAFLHKLEREAGKIGYPVFLRHDLFSGKHGWIQTCYVSNGNQLSSHVAQIIEDWHMVNMRADPDGDDTWVLREFIPIKQPVLMAFAGMPIGRERRCVVRDGEVEEVFPYWPVRAFEWNAPKRITEAIGLISSITREELAIIEPLAESVGKALGGDWTVDFMESERGWMLIDCAQLKDSWTPSLEDREDWKKAIEGVVL